MKTLLEMESWKMFTSVALLFLTAAFVNLYRVLVAKPTKLRASLRQQGVPGPPAHVLLGNIWEVKDIQTKANAEAEGRITAPDKISHHDCEAAVFPYTKKWREEYGDVFSFALGTTQIFYAGGPEMVKEIATYTSLDLGKPSELHTAMAPLLGHGIITSNGDSWARQRKIVAPEFYTDKVKGMVDLVNESAQALIQTWKKVIDGNGGNAEIEIDEYMRSFSGDVISKACFGSNYKQGEAIFGKIKQLKLVLTKSLFVNKVPGMRKMPTKNNREAWELEKDIRDLILHVAGDRKKQGKHDQKDLLQIILEGAAENKSSQKDMEQFVVDNCKNIYLAGYETTAVTTTWCMMLLAVHQEWQDRVREEILSVVSDGRVPGFDALQKMKLLTMVIHETLRLYPPASMITREALKDIKTGGFHIPQGVNVWTMIPSLHTDPKAWGPDSYSFNPTRFADGVASACKYPHFYMPFGVGPRICLGQNLATIELKTILSSIVTNFSFSLSPKYVHSPHFNMVIEPQHGVPLLIKHL